MSATLRTSVLARRFTSRAVDGFTGAVGNTPLVSASEHELLSYHPPERELMSGIRRRADSLEEMV